jgi:hypothetical protein
VYKHINPFQQISKTMNISRLLPFLPLLVLLPVTSSAALVFPSTNQSRLNPSELCPLVQIVEHELCVNQQEHRVNLHLQHNANNASDLCVLLHNYNTSFCAGDAPVVEPLSDDGMSIRILEKEFHEETQDKDKDIHKVCPIINFIEQELCTSRNEEIKVQFDPKQLCPLLNLTYTEICE